MDVVGVVDCLSVYVLDVKSVGIIFNGVIGEGGCWVFVSS